MRELCAIVGGRILVPAGVLSRGAERDLRARFTFSVPGWRSHNGRSRIVVAVDESPRGLLIPRGGGHVLESVARADGVCVVFDDRTADGAELPVQYRPPGGGRLHRHQRAAVRALVQHRDGMVVIPCGGGKTTAGLATIAALGRTAVVCVHTRDLLAQWLSEIEAQLGVEAIEAGSALATGPVVVAMVQALALRSRASLGQWSRNFGVAVLDECHHAPAETFRAVFGHIESRYRIGLTATHERADGLGPLARVVIGPLLYEATVQDLVDAGRLVIPEITRLDTWNRYSQARDYRELLDAIELDDHRNSAIVDRVRRHVADGRRVIVLTLRVRHCTELARLLGAIGLRAVALHGKIPKNQRAVVLDRFRAGDLDVLVGTKLADEGLDVPRADALVLAMPSRASGAAAQRTGRVIRAVEGKRAIVDDIVDGHRIARQHWYARQREYRDRYGESSLRPAESLLQRELVGRGHGS